MRRRVARVVVRLCRERHGDRLAVGSCVEKARHRDSDEGFDRRQRVHGLEGAERASLAYARVDRSVERAIRVLDRARLVAVDVHVRLRYLWVDAVPCLGDLRRDEGYGHEEVLEVAERAVVGSSAFELLFSAADYRACLHRRGEVRYPAVVVVQPHVLQRALEFGHQEPEHGLPHLVGDPHAPPPVDHAQVLVWFGYVGARDCQEALGHALGAQGALE